MISVGDHVVYRHHVCKVARFLENYYQDKDYYELHALFENSLKLFITVDDAVAPALRPVMTRQEALALIDSIDDADHTGADALKRVDGSTLMDRKVKDVYNKKLAEFSPDKLLLIMKYAHERSRRRERKGRNATATDKRYYQIAENLLVDELAVSLDMDRDEANDFLVERIEQASTRV